MNRILPMVPYEMELDELRAQALESRIREQVAREACEALQRYAKGLEGRIRHLRRRLGLVRV